MFTKNNPDSTNASIIATLTTAFFLSIILLKVKSPVMLLAERFFPGAGWSEIILLSLYAGWITEKLINPSMTPVIRRRIWLFFSIVFFTQLALGLAGIEKLLMTGKLHLPVPALIIAGPLFRGENFFMLILFFSTVIICGPAWCSYLCYIGAWDNVSSLNQKHPTPLPSWKNTARLIIFMIIVISSLSFRFIGIPGITATLFGGLVGLIGIGIMVFISRKKGVMVHCSGYCPIGLLADTFGKISPFRLKINSNCTGCGACQASCRYNALNKKDIESHKPGFTCTLCGDCLHRCHEKAIEYSFLKFNPETARKVFLVILVSLHAIFLGVARL